MPPLEPPGVLLVSHGFRVSPLRSDSVKAMVPNSGVFVLPTMTKPASRMRRTTAVSKSGTLSASARHEYVVRVPAVAVRSFTAIGTPRNGASPPRSSDSRASASASSPRTVTKAFSSGSRRSIRSR